jgi:hypothetical protein
MKTAAAIIALSVAWIEHPPPARADWADTTGERAYQEQQFEQQQEQFDQQREQQEEFNRQMEEIQIEQERDLRRLEQDEDMRRLDEDLRQ